MVDELPELEGVIGRAYALAEGQPAEVAEALESGVRLSPPAVLCQLPRWRRCSRSPTGWINSSAFLRSVSGFGLSRPLRVAPRRGGVARILNAQGWRVSLAELVGPLQPLTKDSSPTLTGETVNNVVGFYLDRVAGLLELEHIPVTLVRAVTADAPRSLPPAGGHISSRRSAERQSLNLCCSFTNAPPTSPNSSTLKPKSMLNGFSSPYEQPLYDAIPEAKGALEELLGAVQQELTPWDLGRWATRELKNLPGLPEILALKAPLDAFWITCW